MSHFAAFLGVSVVVIATPGPDTALTIRNTLLGTRRTGVFTALGVAAGQAVWTVAASAGIVALLVASEPAFLAVRVAGAAYLVYLGASALREALRGQRVAASEPVAGSGRRLHATAALRQGLFSDLGNPKMAVFFTSLLPQFAPAHLAALLLLGLAFCAMTFAWLALYAGLVAWAGDVLRRPKVRRLVEVATGTVLVALGLRLATERR
jgi:threonine/homoserine/homoserine lactone efflux protein